MSLMRLAYASEATFEAKPVEKGVEPHVARILMTSRKNNARDQLVGGLYYGNDRFFQYLEGDEDAVRRTFDRILKDERHRNVVTLIEEPLTSRTFSNWSMKYVPLSRDVRNFLDEQGLESFEPSSFTSDQCEKNDRANTQFQPGSESGQPGRQPIRWRRPPGVVVWNENGPDRGWSGAGGGSGDWRDHALMELL